MTNKTKTIKVSVIIPVYNAGKYFADCLKSISLQSYANTEIIIIDDGSTDNSRHIAEDYSRSDDRIMIYSFGSSQGVSSARNLGLTMATGDYVMFIDADDWIENNTIERLVEVITKWDMPDVLFYNFLYERSGKIVKNKKYPTVTYPLSRKDKEIIIAETLAPFVRSSTGKGLGYCWNKIIKASVYKQLLFPMPGLKPYGEDLVFTIEAISKTNKVLFLDDYLYHYRINHSSLSFAFNNDILLSNDIFFREVESLVGKIDKRTYYSRALYMLVKEIQLFIFNKSNKVSFLKKMRIMKMELKKQPYAVAIKDVRLSDLNTYLRWYLLLFRMRFVFGIFCFSKLDGFLRRFV